MRPAYETVPIAAQTPADPVGQETGNVTPTSLPPVENETSAREPAAPGANFGAVAGRSPL